MFVKANTIGEIKAYFTNELSHLYSENEIRLILKQLTAKRFKYSDSEYLLMNNKLLSESDLLYYHFALKRLRDEEPFQYVLGETEFCDLILDIDKRALIPRPETEELVYWIVETLASKNQPRIMDLCSGSGCIALSLKSLITDSEVVAVELSDEALSLIAENSAKTKLDISTVQTDVLESGAFQKLDPNSFDCWVSNPPYIPESDRNQMAKNVLQHEPPMALFVNDDDPLIFYQKIAESARLYLNENGWLFFEIHEDFALDVHQLLIALGFVNIEVRKDLQGKDRMMRAQTVSSKHES